ncbi:MAG: hypothetical protein AAF939_17830 [Planctomycetota bacterium]
MSANRLVAEPKDQIARKTWAVSTLILKVDYLPSLQILRPNPELSSMMSPLDDFTPLHLNPTILNPPAPV